MFLDCVESRERFCRVLDEFQGLFLNVLGFFFPFLFLPNSILASSPRRRLASLPCDRGISKVAYLWTIALLDGPKDPLKFDMLFAVTSFLLAGGAVDDDEEDGAGSAAMTFHLALTLLKAALCAT